MADGRAVGGRVGRVVGWSEEFEVGAFCAAIPANRKDTRKKCWTLIGRRNSSPDDEENRFDLTIPVCGSGWRDGSCGWVGG